MKLNTMEPKPTFSKIASTQAMIPEKNVNRRTPQKTVSSSFFCSRTYFIVLSKIIHFLI